MNIKSISLKTITASMMLLITGTISQADDTDIYLNPELEEALPIIEFPKMIIMP